MAKISTEAVAATAEMLKQDLELRKFSKDLPTVFATEYVAKGLSVARFLWDLHQYADHVAREAGYSCLFAGRDDQTSWKLQAKFVFDGEINDAHTLTAMKAVAKLLDVDVTTAPAPAIC